MTVCKRRKFSARTPSGTYIAELGPALWLVFLVVFFPMLALGTFGLRYVPLINATRLAAQAAAQCKTFSSDIDSSNKSAVNTASQVVSQSIAGWRGISVQSTSTSIVICNLSTGSVTRQSTPLNAPANTSTNAYDCEVSLQATINPLVTMPRGIFGNIPGLTAPIQTKTRSVVVFESAQGLTQ